MSIYAPFGNAVYDQTVFGPPPSQNTSTVLSITPIDYDGLQLSWPTPGGSWNQQVLLRSSFGTPNSVYDGAILLDESSSYSTQYRDTGLRPGHFYYYSLFVYDTVLEGFVLADSAQGLIVTDWAFGSRYANWVPEFYLDMDNTITTAAYPNGPGPLIRFLNLLGYEMDWMRSEIESMFLFTNVDQISGALLPYLGANYGMDYEPALGMIRSRVLVKNAVNLYKNRGTAAGIAAAASAFTGFGAEVSLGPNISTQLDDSAFDLSVGHWVTNPLGSGTSTIAAVSAFSVGLTGRGGSTAHTPYNPQHNGNVAVIGNSSGDAINLTTCTAENSVTLGIPVSESTYTVSAYVRPYPQATPVVRSFYMQIDWYSAAGALLGSTAGTPVQEVVGSWVRPYVIGTPPDGAFSFARTIRSTAAVSSSEKHLFDAEQTEVNNGNPSTWDPPRDIKVNLLPNRQNLVTNPTGLGGTTGWSATNCTISTSTSGSFPASVLSGFTVSSITANSASVSIPIPVALAGIVYSVSAYILCTTPSSVITQLAFYNGAGTVLALYSQTDLIGTSYDRTGLANIVAPEGTVRGVFTITQNNPLRSTFDFTAVLVEPSDFILPYFDANFAPAGDYLWEGNPNQSISDYYPNLQLKVSRLTTALLDYIPIGSTFSVTTVGPFTPVMHHANAGTASVVAVAQNPTLHGVTWRALAGSAQVVVSGKQPTVVTEASGQPLTITTASLPNAVQGTPYTDTLTATGGTPPYTWTIVSS